jgi:peptidoglycan-N-acetylglucosamine deacetylase
MKSARTRSFFWLNLHLSRKRLLAMVMAGVLLLAGLFWHGAPAERVSVVSVLSGQDDHALRDRVEQLAKKYNAEPIDAKNDRVWKAIPGLNGLQVDVEATLDHTQGLTGDRIPLVYKQIPPKVSLDDLGALPIYRGNPAKKQMSLMINVAWGTEYLAEILAILDKNSVKATFFLDGSWTAKNGEIAKKIVEKGHEIGNHAYTHPDMAKLGSQRTMQEIVRTNDVIQKATGIRPKLFAPPSGSYSDLTVKTAHGQGMRTIMWTLDTVDWRRPPAATILSRIVPKAQNGALVLMHPTEPTVVALRTMIPELEKKGYRLVTVSELLSQERPIPRL